MTERIDHAKKARRNIDGLHDYQAEEGMSDESMLTVAIEAQVHATLALVEQQRIANLIQLTHVPVGDLNDDIRSALHAAFHRGPDNWEEALGLT